MKVLILALLIVAMLTTGCELGGVEKPTHTRVPTNTPVPNVATRNFVAVNDRLATESVATFTPGPDVETISAVQSQLTLDAVLTPPSPTSTVTQTFTPLPSHTRVPTGTPVPGIATEVYAGVNATLAADGQNTNTPGPNREAQIATQIAATVAAS